MSNKKTSKHLVRNAGYSLTISAIVLVVVILVNVLVSAIPLQYTRFDMTKTGLYTATSPETEECLAQLDQDIILYYLCESGAEDLTVKTFVEKYATLSDHVTFKVIDPVVYPNFAAEYEVENAVSNTLVVVNENMTDDAGNPLSYVVQGGLATSVTEQQAQENVLSEFYGWKVDVNAYYSTGATVYYPATFIGEQQMAKAINYVTNTEWPKVYMLSGHGEGDLSRYYDLISNDIIKFENLMLGDPIPEDCRMIIVFQPIFDLTEQEYDQLSKYLNDGGDIMFLMSHSDKSDLANFSKLFESYGFEIDYDHYVLESSPSRQLYSDYPYIFAPLLTDSIAFESIEKMNIYVVNYYAMPINELASHRSSITFNKLCYTQTGYLSTWTDEMPDSTKTYPFVTGAHVVEAYEDIETNIYLFTGLFADKVYNYAVLSDILKETCDVVLTVEIESIDLSYDQLNLLESEASLWSTIVQIVIPSVVLVAGVVMFIIRRRK